MLENATPQREEPVRAWESPPVRLAVDEVEHLGTEPDRMPLEQARSASPEASAVEKVDGRETGGAGRARRNQRAALERARAAAARRPPAPALPRPAGADRAASICRLPVKLEGSGALVAPAAERRRGARCGRRWRRRRPRSTRARSRRQSARRGCGARPRRGAEVASGIGEPRGSARRGGGGARRGGGGGGGGASGRAGCAAARMSRGPDGRLRLDVDDLNRGGDMDVDISMSPNDVELDEFATREKLRGPRSSTERFVPPPLGDQAIQRFDHRQYEAGYRSPTVELLARERAEAAAAEVRAKAGRMAAEVAGGAAASCTGGGGGGGAGGRGSEAGGGETGAVAS